VTLLQPRIYTNARISFHPSFLAGPPSHIHPRPRSQDQEFSPKSKIRKSCVQELARTVSCENSKRTLQRGLDGMISADPSIACHRYPPTQTTSRRAEAGSFIESCSPVSFIKNDTALHTQLHGTTHSPAIGYSAVHPPAVYFSADAAGHGRRKVSYCGGRALRQLVVEQNAREQISVHAVGVRLLGDHGQPCQGWRASYRQTSVGRRAAFLCRIHRGSSSRTGRLVRPGDAKAIRCAATR